MRLFRKPDRMTFIDMRPPTPQPDRAGLTLGVIALNEARDIGEWVRFHEYAGVSRFVLYDDGSTDDTIAKARAACLLAELVVIPWNMRLTNARRASGMNNQTLAFAHCISNFGATCRWMALIDVDEFLIPVTHPTLTAALAARADLPLMTLPWVMFGRSGHEQHPKGGLLRNFLRRARDLRLNSVPGVYNVKPIFDPCRVSQVHVHRLRVDGRWWVWNDAGRRYLVVNEARPSRQSNDLIQLNHYFTRSGQHLADKIAKGGNYTDRAPRTGDLLQRRVAAIETDEVVDHLAIDYIAARNQATGRDFFAELDEFERKYADRLG